MFIVVCQVIEVIDLWVYCTCKKREESSEGMSGEFHRDLFLNNYSLNFKSDLPASIT